MKANTYNMECQTCITKEGYWNMSACECLNKLEEND